MRISFRKLRCRVFWNSLKAPHQATAIETDGQGEDDEIDRWIADRRLGLDFTGALVDRHAGANGKRQNGDHEGLEIDLLAVAEGVGAVGRPSRSNLKSNSAWLSLWTSEWIASPIIADESVQKAAANLVAAMALFQQGGQYNQFGTRCRYIALRGFPG